MKDHDERRSVQTCTGSKFIIKGLPQVSTDHDLLAIFLIRIARCHLAWKKMSILLKIQFILSFAEDNNVFLFFPHLHVVGRPDVVDLEDHLDELGGELDLGLLAMEGLNHALLFHVAGAHLHAVHTKGRVAL